MDYIARFSEAEDAALKAVAAKDGKTVQEVVDEQVRYYVGCVLKDHMEKPLELDEAQKLEYDSRMVLAKEEILTDIAAKAEAAK